MVCKDRKKVNSWIVTFFLTETNICSAISTFISIPNLSILVMAFVIFMILTVYGGKIRLRLDCSVVYIIFLGILILSIGLNGFDSLNQYFFYYLVFGLTALLVIPLDIDYISALKDILIAYMIYLIIYFCRGRQMLLSSSDYWISQMGISYSYILPVIIGFTIIIYRKNIIFASFKKILPPALIEMFLSTFIVVFDCGTRGAVLAIVIGCSLIVIGGTNNLKSIFFIAIIAALIVIGICNMNIILNWFIQKFYNSNITSLAKLSQFIANNNLDNGRNSLYQDAKTYIYESPFIGHGVGYFEKKHNGGYIHGIIYELLCEYGILGMVFFLFPLIKIILTILKDNLNGKKAFLLVLCSTLTMLFYSSSYWLMPTFWYCYYYILIYKKLSGDMSRCDLKKF